MRKKLILDQLPEAEDATTTEGLHTISRYEMEQRRLSSLGKYLYKANGRTIPEGERKERARKLTERLDRQSASQPEPPQRPQSIPATSQSAFRSPYLPTRPLCAGDKRRWEDRDLGELDVGQSNLAEKRRRLWSSPLNPLLQDRSLTPDNTFGDSFQQSPNAHGSSSSLSTSSLHHSPLRSNSTEPGLNFGSGASVNSWDVAFRRNTALLEAYSRQSEETDTDGTLIDVSQNDKFETDYRYVPPQTNLEQLGIQAMLSYARAHYYALFHEYPPFTSEGTYADQYNQIYVNLMQKRNGGGGYLADIGPWSSFNTLSTPNLPEDVQWKILHPHENPGLLLSDHAESVPTPSNFCKTLHDHPNPGPLLSDGAESVLTPSTFCEDSSDWSDDPFCKTLHAHPNPGPLVSDGAESVLTPSTFCEDSSDWSDDPFADLFEDPGDADMGAT